MKDIWKEETVEGVKKINKKKIIVTTVVVIIIVMLTVVGGLYISNRVVRDWIDRNIFRKEV